MAQPFELPPLPFAQDALHPVISAKTLEFHYGKHHKTYVDNLNKLVEGSPYAEMKLEEVIKKSHGSEKDRGVYNNAAQTWNHSFFWNCLSPKKQKPGSGLTGAIEKSFQSFDNFKKEFVDKALKQFGSGWAWLARDNSGKLSVLSTSNADTPITQNQTPLLTVDVWEHAYYLDYQNRRADFVGAVFDQLINWEFAESNLR